MKQKRAGRKTNNLDEMKVRWYCELARSDEAVCRWRQADVGGQTRGRPTAKRASSGSDARLFESQRRCEETPFEEGQRRRPEVRRSQATSARHELRPGEACRALGEALGKVTAEAGGLERSLERWRPGHQQVSGRLGAELGGHQKVSGVASRGLRHEQRASRRIQRVLGGSRQEGPEEMRHGLEAWEAAIG
ncbi:hypothetical protein AAFF_G00199570 [Aldrovandia affinis]|uniref:Uncharacterized protein n=1 Tax=Aldrovandia affinis TaxID=143900 RepID=A0AAD7VWZ6_9TELE|nr:hypothetical protein AAFF_G00199570 [Aldrovandia affinis]